MPTPISSATANPLRTMSVRRLIGAMREFRARTLALVADLDDRQMIGPRLAIVNPPLWEIGHVAWTQEFWVLRHLQGEKPIAEHGDRLYNSTDVAHDTRWELLLPSRTDTLAYMNELLERCIAGIDGKSELSPDEFYFYWLTTFHEGMHAEALAYTRQTLGYQPPPFLKATAFADIDERACPGDVEIPGGRFTIGATQDFPFVFDNEKWAHGVDVKAFRIARTAVTNGEFLAFVEDGGYRKAQYWSAEGWRWLETGGSPALEKSLAKFFNKDFAKNFAPRCPRNAVSKPLRYPDTRFLTPLPLPNMAAPALTFLERKWATGYSADILHESGAQLYACKMAMEMFKLEQKDLVPQVEGVLTVIDFFDKAAGSQILFI